MRDAPGSIIYSMARINLNLSSLLRGAYKTDFCHMLLLITETCLLSKKVVLIISGIFNVRILTLGFLATRIAPVQDAISNHPSRR